MVEYYVIKVDYFIYDETKEDGIGRMPVYLYTTRDKFKVYIFEEKLSADHLDLKWFETEKDARKYIKDHKLEDSSCYDNVRVEKIEYKA